MCSHGGSNRVCSKPCRSPRVIKTRPLEPRLVRSFLALIRYWGTCCYRRHRVRASSHLRVRARDGPRTCRERFGGAAGRDRARRPPVDGGAGGRKRPDTGRGNGGREEPLELHERGAPIVDRGRARGNGVHAVPGRRRRRRPGELHRGGHVRAVPDASGRGSVAAGGQVPRTGRVHARVSRVKSAQLRRDHAAPAFRRDTAQPERRARAVRPDRHGTAVHGLHVARGPYARLAHRVRHPVGHDHARGTRPHRARVAPRVRLPPVGRPRRAADVRPQVHQHPDAGVHRGDARVRQPDAEGHRPATVRPEPRGPPVRDIPEQLPRHRGTEARSAQHRGRRRHSLEAGPKNTDSRFRPQRLGLQSYKSHLL